MAENSAGAVVVVEAALPPPPWEPPSPLTALVGHDAAGIVYAFTLGFCDGGGSRPADDPYPYNPLEYENDVWVWSPKPTTPATYRTFVALLCTSRAVRREVLYVTRCRRVLPSCFSWAVEVGHAGIAALLLGVQGPADVSGSAAGAVRVEDLSVDPSAGGNYAIRRASSLGHAAVVELLLRDDRVDPSARDNDAVVLAVRNGHAVVVDLLVHDTRVDPSARDNYAVVWAALYGRTAVVDLLLRDARVDPSARDNVTIRLSAGRGRTSVVELLLRDARVDPSARGNAALGAAERGGYGDIVEMLRRHARFRDTPGMQSRAGS